MRQEIDRTAGKLPTWLVWLSSMEKWWQFALIPNGQETTGKVADFYFFWPLVVENLKSRYFGQKISKTKEKWKGKLTKGLFIIAPQGSHCFDRCTLVFSRLLNTPQCILRIRGEQKRLLEWIPEKTVLNNPARVQDRINTEVFFLL